HQLRPHRPQDAVLGARGGRQEGGWSPVTAILAGAIVLLAISQIITAITFMQRLSFLENEKERVWIVIDTIIASLGTCSEASREQAKVIEAIIVDLDTRSAEEKNAQP